MSEKTKFNILLVHLITFFVSIPALMIIGHFFPGEAAPGEVSWAVWAAIGVGMAHVVSLFIFFCVLVRQDKKKRIMDDKRAEYLKFHHTSVSKGSLDL